MRDALAMYDEGDFWEKEEEPEEDFWEAQSRLPLRQRDLIWWSEVALSNVVVFVAVPVALVALVVLALLGVL